jgi:hypothetical protein
MALAAAVTMVMARRYSVCYNVRGPSIIMTKAVIRTMKVVLCMFNLCRIGSLYSAHAKVCLSWYTLHAHTRKVSPRLHLVNF